MHELAGHKVRAVSVGGLDTCIELLNWKLCFDIGHCPQSALRWPRVLFTHAHSDHMGGVAHHCSGRDMMGMPPPTYAIPAENAEAFAQLLDAWRKLDRSPMPCEVVPVSPGDRIELGPSRWAEVFRVYHRVPSVGYALCSTKDKLLPEFRGLPGPEIGRLRREGTVITEPVDTVEVAFCGDTLIEVMEREERVRRARLLILEVTFIDERVPVDKARAMGHIHLDEVVERSELFRDNEAVLFTHFSARYREHEIEAALDARLPPWLRQKVTANLDRHTQR